MLRVTAWTGARLKASTLRIPAHAASVQAGGMRDAEPALKADPAFRLRVPLIVGRAGSEMVRTEADAKPAAGKDIGFGIRKWSGTIG